MSDHTDLSIDTQKKKSNVLPIVSLSLSLLSLLIIIVLGVLSFYKYQDMSMRISIIEDPPQSEKPEFRITKFEIEEEKYQYGSSGSVSYIGSGVITEKTGKDDTYLIILRETLVAGGGRYKR